MNDNLCSVLDVASFAALGEHWEPGYKAMVM